MEKSLMLNSSKKFLFRINLVSILQLILVKLDSVVFSDNSGNTHYGLGKI